MYLLCLFFYQHTIHKFSFIVKDRWNETGFAFNYGYHDIQYNDDFKRETIDRGLHVIIEIYWNRFCFYRFLYRELFYVLPPLKPTPQHTPPSPIPPTYRSFSEELPLYSTSSKCFKENIHEHGNHCTRSSLCQVKVNASSTFSRMNGN